MEFYGAFLDQEWEPLINMFSFEDNYNVLFPIDQNTHFYCASQECSNSSEFEFETNRVAAVLEVEDNSFRAADRGGGFSHQGTFEPMDFVSPAIFSDEVRQLKAETWCEEQGNAGEGGDSRGGVQLKRKFVEAAENDVPQPPKANKTKRNTRSKKSKTISVDEQANDNVVGNGQSSSSCSSEQGDSNELISGKSKAGKGPATDSQSIYARKRRERINERLKILQTLVPNGTKVDISTMLEEAVDYVKFLQLQIKLLSSDDTWMYAPIAYNGMDMGLYQKIIPNL